jgi:uncharacterized membrane protein YraQ (UPF0718 family)
MPELVATVLAQTAATLAHNWPYLLAGILSAAALKVYVGTARIASLFRRRTGSAVAGSVAVAVATPFCSCGTTAVVLSMLAASVPWAPVVAFMVSSPLTSPDEFLLSAGLFGLPFAALFFGASVVLGFAGGAIAWAAEDAGWLRNQARFAAAPDEAACAGTCTPAPCCPARQPAFGPGAAAVAEFEQLHDRWRLHAYGREVLTAATRMLPLFVGFAAIGYLAIAIVPTAWIAALLGGSSPASVVAAATLGVPFYFSTEGSLPLVASLMDGGMGEGPAMAFLITGAGTSIAALSGGLLIARWRVLAIVVTTLWVGAIITGLVASAVL